MDTQRQAAATALRLADAILATDNMNEKALLVQTLENIGKLLHLPSEDARDNKPAAMPTAEAAVIELTQNEQGQAQDTNEQHTQSAELRAEGTTNGNPIERAQDEQAHMQDAVEQRAQSFQSTRSGVEIVMHDIPARTAQDEPDDAAHTDEQHTQCTGN